MGNDAHFIDVDDLPFRLIDIPIGTAPPPPTPPIRRSHKRRAPPAPPPRVDGYDAPPSLSPPPIIPKRSDIPSSPAPPIPPRFDLDREDPFKCYTPNKTHYHSKKFRKTKLACCVVS
ncbi:unnamed protein product [Adineta ricciae]|uniref:Uncharacterized protein n=1 Tax=Adineta ricciae TaxID=249248 RepID=A0A815JDY9_ADIRI|nr:unnamed protein product [Adineta ricciae]CAF1469342.1 unnamed protein product [Adineta ricciae]